MSKYIVSSIILVLVDYIYLSIIKDFFGNQIKKVQGSPMKVNLVGAILCYIILVLGINYFIIYQNKSILDAFLLGLLIYGVYETTNYALFSNWSVSTVIIDTLWGGILFALTTYLTRYFFPVDFKKSTAKV
jgi:uncharacterized membrane protein